MSTAARGVSRIRPKRAATNVGPVALSEALPVSRWAWRQFRPGFLAKWWGIHKATVSRQISEGRNALTELCALVEHSGANGEAVVTALLESLEKKYIREAREDRKACEERLAYLMSREHSVEAGQNRALQSGEDVEDACLQHVATLLEIVGRRRALGLGSDE
jgi:hypothetical protein